MEMSEDFSSRNQNGIWMEEAIFFIEIWMIWTEIQTAIWASEAHLAITDYLTPRDSLEAPEATF